MAESRQVAIERLRPWVERARNFSGWDLSLAEPTLLEPGPPWDYERLARDLVNGARSVLDIGTGGGEVLSRIIERSPARFVATEQWHVNAPVAASHLSPLGVEVVHAESLRLPFRAGTFDLVLNRHEEMDCKQVASLLQPAGTVLTQQVGGDNWIEMRHYFPRWVLFEDIFQSYVAAFEAAGLEVEARQHRYKVAYPSLGHVTYLLALMPWQLPDFDLERDLDALLALEAGLATPRGIVVTESRDLIVASHPGDRN
jgi:SAM-dependent methyltransferase